ncbi:cobalamin biosynthesis protein CobW [Rhizobiales bacterium]|uniref:cobalamin biosynthesis protein CobW n=1 Tax=Hongsoonwoonella zoysiae TaxID=2821844 RepID=UPI001560071C|nr:cobalamin biosynthesis protein CobW [Hongsoonwoonella zoysiae]NRG19050.1 cobalamin biosynthesis protein CobW [Hongsoonwoonella zoysiae]
MSAGTKIPATIVTGFLGAGKTTLLRNLLQGTEGKRIALIVNEFGDMGFDGSLVDGCADPGCKADEVVELTNGCICCTVADDFLPTMEMLISRNPAPDHIVIETSGLALPQPLVRAFSWPSVKTRVTVDAVVTVVDAAAVAEGKMTGDLGALEIQRAADEALDHESPIEELFEDQLVCADLVVINKADLVTVEDMERVRGEIASHVRASVEVVAAENGKLDGSILLGRGSAAEEDMAARLSHHEAHHADDEDHHHEHHHDDFESFVIDAPGFSSMEEAQGAVREAMATHGVLRIKGAVSISGKPAPAIVQAVGPRVETWFAREAKAPGRLVVIGLKGFSLDEVKVRLAQKMAA